MDLVNIIQDWLVTEKFQGRYEVKPTSGVLVPFSKYGLFDKITGSYPAAVWGDNLRVYSLDGERTTLFAADPEFFEKLKDYLDDRSRRLPPLHNYGTAFPSWTL